LVNTIYRMTRAAGMGLVPVLYLAGTVGCAGNLAAKPDVFASHQEMARVANTDVRLTLVKPVGSNPPPFLVVFASGDGGLLGVSKAVLQHLADRGFWVAAFSSPDAFGHVVAQSDRRPNYAAARGAFSSIVVQAKRALALPDRTPLVVAGLSRGANVVIASAGDPTLKTGIVGALAIALTREFDDLTVPDNARQLPNVKMDDKGRLQTYPAIERLGSIPLAIIQSTNDSYVPSAESRRLLGPDTRTRRLYEVQSKNHSFAGGREPLMRDIDAAMSWIAGLAAGDPH